MSQPGQVEVRCTSAACVKSCGPAGRLLYAGAPVVVKRRRHGIILVGVTVLVTCGCGWVWRNYDRGVVLDTVDALAATKG